jgi:hypothetical protein
MLEGVMLGDATEEAYARGDLLAKRARLMEARAKFISTPHAGAQVVPMRRKRA